jgi:hypothetical protein
VKNDTSPPAEGLRHFLARGTRARRWLNFAAVVAAALASMATSQAPPPHAPPQLAVAAPAACASLALQVCEASPEQTFVVVEATGVGVGECTVAIAHAEATGAYGGTLGELDRLPSPIVVGQGATGTFSLSFPRTPDAADPAGRAVVRLDVRSGREGYGPTQTVQVLSQACTAR